jgi:hypothetical protein
MITIRLLEVIWGRSPFKMIICLLWIMMALVGSSATATQSDRQIVSYPANRKQANQRTSINNIPGHLLADQVFPYLSTEDTDNFLSSPFAHIKSILKIWNPKRRLKLLKKALENNDPAFDDNYLGTAICCCQGHEGRSRVALDIFHC